jgi:lactoylglutathione lyase
MKHPASRSRYAKAAAALVLSLSFMMVGAPAVAEPELPIQTSLDHVAFEVADIDRSIKFYSENFGFRLTRRADYAFNGTTTDAEHADLTAAFMHLGSTALELIQLRKPVSGTAQGQTKNPGVFHLGLYMKDVRGAHKLLSERGVKFVSEPKLRDGIYVAAVRDPDGVMLELMEVESSTVK